MPNEALTALMTPVLRPLRQKLALQTKHNRQRTLLPDQVSSKAKRSVSLPYLTLAENPLIQDVDIDIPPPTLSISTYTADANIAKNTSADAAKDKKYDGNEEDEVDWDDSPLT